ncbi:MAG: ABC transporter permease [Candidatus Endonucleobacter bathymodioli]|uniref:Transport permease protein n=1 Tax=Candidatus Endonucleibacter bathymodioli TaxID=539814 RepID=A0AA90NQJ1_9GAMM|nr:ABC transporter permease [Candidatus Endonucleobacter bathymodioli]
MTYFKANHVAFNTILFREIRRFMRIWPQTLLPPAMVMSLYFVIFGGIIGNRIGDMMGYSYMTYIVPGLVMMSVITNSFSNVAFSFFSIKFQKSVEELLVSPVPNSIILAGYVLGGAFRGLISGFMVMGVGLFFVDFHLHNLLITFLAVAMTAILCALGGFINAIHAKTFDDISIIPTFLLTPLTYLGGVFYSIEVLPEFWRNLSLFNPVLYQVNAFRYGILGETSGININMAFSVMTGVIIVLTVYSLQLLNSGKGLRS